MLTALKHYVCSHNIKTFLPVPVFVWFQSLTGGNGFYLSDTKERWWPERKIVIRDTQTGEFMDDFSASSTDRALATCREILGLPANELVEVIPAKYPRYELYFESASRNKTMKGGSKFLYQVVPGTTEQCQRLLIRSAKIADLDTIQKLVVFFKSTPSFINCQDPSTGNTALHIASRCGHLEVAEYLLQNNAGVNSVNMVGCTPLFLAAESIHKDMCQLLLEWNADLQHRNRQSKTVIEVTRNVNLRELLQSKDTEYSTLRRALINGNVSELLGLLKNHSSDKQFLINLQSRVCKGNTVFHIASKLGNLEAVKLCIDLHIDVNIFNAQGATPLHLTRSLDIIKMLLEAGAAVNATTSKGNTVLHLLCKLVPSLITNNCIELLVNHGALLNVRNKEGFMPVHCTAVAGDCDRLLLLLRLDAQTGDKMREALKEEMVEPRPPSLLYLSIENNHLKLAEMLEKEQLEFKEGEVDRLAALILTLKLPQTKVVSTYQLLLRHGASFNDSACSPLCLAAMQPLYPEFVQLLLDQGADPNMVDSELGSPLFCACKANNPHAALMLLKAGANYTTENSQGLTPFDVIPEHHVWIRSGLFDEEMQSVLSVHKWRKTKHLVSEIERRLHTTRGQY
ncbi:ankyrin-1-like [Dysidea avara]|uniref:ankyrin-1-like n=1 Tax=Dysidea avara TaxID=196820 RepID=UPI00331CF450